MAIPRGTIAILGSGETADSMVRVHRYLLGRLSPAARAVFIDTPAGFQMNADDLFDKSREYFLKRLNRPLERASFRSAQGLSSYEAERAYQALRDADYIFVGPGSPTYALKNWVGTQIPKILEERVREGACFVAASAAALTLGRFTLPVYEIYKVGEEVHWVGGLDLLGRFGLPLVVIPHWNNAEGGTHDTRFCYMGEPRLVRLETLLPPGIPILGVDEHTACILDFSADRALIRGAGGVTLRHGGEQTVYRRGEEIPLGEFRRAAVSSPADKPIGGEQVRTIEAGAQPFRLRVKSLREDFERHLQEFRSEGLIRNLLDLDQLIWKACGESGEEENLSGAREIFRGMIVQLGLRLAEVPGDTPSALAPLVEALLEVRERLRSARQWELADFIRDRIGQVGIVVEDTPQGARWRFDGEAGGKGRSA
mgnify:CR=1 FL=1